MLEGTGDGDPTTWLQPVDDDEYKRPTDTTSRGCSAAGPGRPGSGRQGDWDAASTQPGPAHVRPEGRPLVRTPIRRRRARRDRHALESHRPASAARAVATGGCAGGPSAVVVGFGLGADAEFVAAKGFVPGPFFAAPPPPRLLPISSRMAAPARHSRPRQPLHRVRRLTLDSFGPGPRRTEASIRDGVGHRMTFTDGFACPVQHLDRDLMPSPSGGRRSHRLNEPGLIHRLVRRTRSRTVQALPRAHTGTGRISAVPVTIRIGDRCCDITLMRKVRARYQLATSSDGVGGGCPPPSSPQPRPTVPLWTRAAGPDPNRGSNIRPGGIEWPATRPRCDDLSRARSPRS